MSAVVQEAVTRLEAESLAFCNLPVANHQTALENQNSDGVLAQLVEHHNGIVGVRGSNPLGSSDSAFPASGPFL